MSVYDAYKPLRNFLRKLDVHNALGVVRHYSVRKMLDEPPLPPRDLELHPYADRLGYFLPWDLEILAREIIIASPIAPFSTTTLLSSKSMSMAMEKVKAIDSYISKEFVNGDNALHELTARITHRQFKYQLDRPSSETFVRYARLFTHPAVATIFSNKIGLSAKQVYTIGATMWLKYITHLGMNYPLTTLDLPEVNSRDYDTFVNHFSLPLDELRNKLENPPERHMDDSFLYAYHSLYNYPLIFTHIDGQPMHICPLPVLFFWRITSGIYYDLMRDRAFGNAFGKSFEDYTGAVLSKSLRNSQLNIYEGEPNSSRSPNRCDWVVEDAESYLLIECKTKRLAMTAKTSLSTEDYFEQLKVLSEAVVQAYKSLKAYRDDSYTTPVLTMEQSKSAYVCVVTLEKWYVMGNKLQELRDIVSEKMGILGMRELMAESPFIVMPIDDLEKYAYLAYTNNASALIQPYIDSSDMREWEFGTYLREVFKQQLSEYSYVFDDETDTYFTA